MQFLVAMANTNLDTIHRYQIFENVITQSIVDKMKNEPMYWGKNTFSLV